MKKRLWVSARCYGCGATIRALFDADTIIAHLESLAEAAGIPPGDLTRAMGSGDAAGIEALTDKIMSAPTTLSACLASIRNAMKTETQNWT